MICYDNNEATRALYRGLYLYLYLLIYIYSVTNAITSIYIKQTWSAVVNLSKPYSRFLIPTANFFQRLSQGLERWPLCWCEVPALLHQHVHLNRGQDIKLTECLKRNGELTKCVERFTLPHVDSLEGTAAACVSPRG